MKRVFLILLLLLLICACAQAEQTRYPSSGENLPQLHALIVSGASKVKTIYMPIAGCEALYETLPANKIHVDVQPSNLFFRSYDSEESIGGLPSCTREEFEGWIDEAFGQSEEGDLNIFYYCGHTAGMEGQLDTYGAMCSAQERYPYADLAQDLAVYQGDFLVFIDACFSETFETEGLAQLSAEDRERFTLIYSAESDASAWMGSMTNAIAKGIRRNTDGALNADDREQPDDIIQLTELYAFIENDTNGDGKVSADEMIDRITNTGAAAMYLSSGTNWCLFQFSSADIAESSVTLGLSAEPEKVQLNVSLKEANTDAMHTVFWQSSDESVVIVDGSGRLTPVGVGKATVTAYLCNAFGQPCIGSADTCEVTVQEPEIQFYGLPTVDEWGFPCTEIHMRSVDATGGVLADVVVESINDTLIGERFIAYELESGAIYCELATMLDGVGVRYNLYHLNDGIPLLVQSVYDPGYTNAVGLYDSETDTELLCYEGRSSWQDVEREYRSVLEDAFSATDLHFDQVASISSRDGHSSGEYVSADLSGAEQLCCAESRDELPTLLELSGIGTLENEELVTITPVAEIDGRGNSQAPKNAVEFGESIVTTGDVNVRTGPGLSYDSVGIVPKGGSLSYLEEASTDERGVDWYKVAYDGNEYWVSSTYAALTD